jgi:hypothetical protein
MVEFFTGLLVACGMPIRPGNVSFSKPFIRWMSDNGIDQPEQSDLVMLTNFHESYAGSEIKPPSERSTGLVFAALAAILAISWRNSPTLPLVALGMAAMLATVSLIAPVLLKPLNILWFQFGLLLHRVVNPIVMFAVFAAVFVPAGAMIRLWRDPLRLRRRTTEASTYWIERSESGNAAGSMTNQF